MNQRPKVGYEIEGRKVTPIICVYCHPCGLDGIHFFEDLGYCIKCDSYYKYDRNKEVSHVEVKPKIVK